MQLFKLTLISTIVFSSAALYAQEETTPYYNTKDAEIMGDFSFTEAERDSVQSSIETNIGRIKELHQVVIPNSVPPAILFNPLPLGFKVPDGDAKFEANLPGQVKRPKNDTELAFMPLSGLSVLIKNKKISSVELTNIYLSRLKQHSDTLECLITLLEDRAIEQAERADKEIIAGNYRGPLHGIPYGIKDLFALEGYKTTWGAAPYKEQMLDHTATVIKKLEEAGAVLIAKLTMGALARGDVWYGGVTKNPWNLSEGSSGSSAGSGSATAAGLVGFAIGTETLGSIASPSTRNGVTGLRPTYGRVSRYGAMALSWSMDKAGPMCRTAEGTALVFNEIYGPDGLDLAIIDAPFTYKADQDPKMLKVGYFKSLFERDYSTKALDQDALKVFESLGIELIPVDVPDDIPYSAMRIILQAESAAAFDALTRSDRDDVLVRQDSRAWPNFFRAGRLIPAVDYINANRLRTLMIQEWAKLFEEYDVIITPTFGGPQLLATNLTGHPVVIIPNGFKESGSPASISILGRLFDEGTILSLAKAYQDATSFDEQHPPLFSK